MYEKMNVDELNFLFSNQYFKKAKYSFFLTT